MVYKERTFAKQAVFYSLTKQNCILFVYPVSERITRLIPL